MKLFLSLYCLLLLQFNISDFKVEDFVESISIENSVNDYGDLFTSEEEDQLSSKLDEIKETDNISYIVITLERLEGNPVFKVATLMLDKWKEEVNAKRKHPYDAGILILFSRDDYIAYIATSQETDAYLPHQKIKEIIEIEVVPSLRHGNYLGGTIKGIDAVHNYLRHSFGKQRAVGKIPFFAYFFGIVVLVFVFIVRKRYYN